MTLTVPAACAGTVALIEELLTKLTFVAAVVSNVTVTPDTKLLPLMVTAAPPGAKPEVGLTDVRAGAGGCGGGGGGPPDAGKIVLSFFNAPGAVFR